VSTIVAGHFQLQDQADQARLELIKAGFPEDQISIFYLNPPGQHDLYELGGDRDQSPGAEEAPPAVVKGVSGGSLVGAVVGVATEPVTGPLGPILGALVGAHVGSLFSLSKMKEAGEPEDGAENAVEPRKPGMLVAVALSDPADEGRVLDLLHALGAHHIERAQGTIADGDWVDFDPLSTPAPLP
jgi:hypothetical protein